MNRNLWINSWFGLFMTSFQSAFVSLFSRLFSRRRPSSRHSHLVTKPPYPYLPEPPALCLSLEIELWMALLLTDDETLLNLLADHPITAATHGEAIFQLWRAAWEVRACDWKYPRVRRFAWEVLFRLSLSESDYLKLFQTVLPRERDWYVLEMLARWVPDHSIHREKLRQLWAPYLTSPYPALQFHATKAVQRLTA